jgi:hypothetical protein
LSTLESIKNHVHHLSVDIGARGSTTPEEKLAADYAERTPRELGLTPMVERFTSAKSAWRPFALGTLAALISELVFWFGGLIGAIVAFLITAIFLVSLVLELSFRSNLLRWFLPKGQSQNVSALVEWSAESKQTIVLVGHIDTHRMPISHRSLRWLLSSIG